MYWRRVSIQDGQAPGDATVLKRFFHDNFVIFRHRSKRIGAQVWRTRLSAIDNRAFPVTGAHVCNGLPHDVMSCLHYLFSASLIYSGALLPLTDRTVVVPTLSLWTLQLFMSCYVVMFTSSHSLTTITAPCGLRGCKNRPAPFPGRMWYKATKPGSVCRVS